MENRWIKRRLNTLGISNKNFLKGLGIQEQHFKWLEGKPKISPQILEEIARRLQCDYQKLLLFWDNKISESELRRYFFCFYSFDFTMFIKKITIFVIFLLTITKYVIIYPHKQSG